LAKSVGKGGFFSFDILSFRYTSPALHVFAVKYSEADCAFDIFMEVADENRRVSQEYAQTAFVENCA